MPKPLSEAECWRKLTRRLPWFSVHRLPHGNKWRVAQFISDDVGWAAWDGPTRLAALRKAEKETRQ